MRGRSRRCAAAAQGGGRENESALGGVPGFPKRRPKVQQLLPLPGAECLHPRRRQYQSGGLVQILGQKGRLSVYKNLPSLNEAARYPRGNRAACSLGPRSRSPTSVRILRLRRVPALIRINGCAVAQKHHSTGNCHCSGSDIALAGFLFYPDLAPDSRPFRTSERQCCVAQWAKHKLELLGSVCR